MKSIDIKSLLIGIFMTSTLFLGLGAAGGGRVGGKADPRVAPTRARALSDQKRFTGENGERLTAYEWQQQRKKAGYIGNIGSPNWLRAKGLTHPEWVAQGEPDNPVVNTGHILGPQVGAWVNAQARASSANKLGGKANPIHVVIDSAP